MTDVPCLRVLRYDYQIAVQGVGITNGQLWVLSQNYEIVKTMTSWSNDEIQSKNHKIVWKVVLEAMGLHRFK